VAVLASSARRSGAVVGAVPVLQPDRPPAPGIKASARRSSPVIQRGAVVSSGRAVPVLHGALAPVPAIRRTGNLSSKQVAVSATFCRNFYILIFR
jgi:hypothetical protein